MTDPAQSAYLAVSHRVGEELLRHLDRIAHRHGIQYFLTSGTLLGAVRSGTWIPWDDDVDVIMFRRDFELLRTADALDSTEIRFSDGRSNSEHITVIPRLLYRPSNRLPSGRTRARRPIETRHLALDIFVLDRAPGCALSRRLWLASLYALEQASVARNTSPRDIWSEPTISVGRRVLELVVAYLVRPLPATRWHDLRERCAGMLAHRNDDGPYVATNYSTKHGRSLSFRLSSYLPPTAVSFCGDEFPAPRRPTEVLSALFGPGFEEPPPAHLRAPSHLRNGVDVRIDGQIFRIRPSSDGR